MPIAVVTGANGFIGSHLVEHLLDTGHRVRALVRPDSDRSFLDPRAEPVIGDVRQPLSLVPAVRGAGTVYHVAGVVATFRERTFYEVNVDGSRAVLAACRKECPDLGRFVLVSSLAAAGPARNGCPVRETDRPHPVSSYGASKLLAEQAVFAEAGMTPVTVVRPPVVYGPRDRDMLFVFQFVVRGGSPAFSREKYYSVVHVRDLVTGIVAAGTAAGAVGKVYNLADPRAYSLTHFLSVVAGALGVRTRRIPSPDGILPLLARISDAVLPSLGIPVRPLLDKVRELRPDYWIADSTRAFRDFGWRSRVSLEEGVAETARFYRDQGWIRLPAWNV